MPALEADMCSAMWHVLFANRNALGRSRIRYGVLASNVCGWCDTGAFNPVWPHYVKDRFASCN